MICPAIPTSDPNIPGQLWNDNGVLKVSPPISIDPANFQPEKEKAEAMIRVKPKKYRNIDDPTEVSCEKNDEQA